MSTDQVLKPDSADLDSFAAAETIEMMLTNDPCLDAGNFAAAPEATWGMEMNVARLPIWTTTSTARPPSTIPLQVGTYIGEDVFVTESAGSLTVRDHALNARLTKELALAGYLRDGGVLLPVADGDPEQIAVSLERLTKTSIESKLDFGGRERRFSLPFTLFERYERYEDSYLVWFSRPHVALLRGGKHTTWLDSDLYLRMLSHDERAPVLWAFWRSQRLSVNWPASVFGTPKKEPGFYPLIAHLLGYQRYEYRDRKTAVNSIATTAATICEIDPAYTAEVVKAKGTLAWNLVVKCSKGVYVENVQAEERMEVDPEAQETPEVRSIYIPVLHPTTTSQESASQKRHIPEEHPMSTSHLIDESLPSLDTAG